ncbi:MAG TPA: hypothetical protein VGK22_02965 [Candidatus Angelobacter sp.]|jgi:hypothetical protein
MSGAYASNPSREQLNEYEMFVAFMVAAISARLFHLLSGLFFAIFLLPWLALLYVAGLALLLAIDILRALVRFLVGFLVAVFAINGLGFVVDLILVCHIVSPYGLDSLYWFFLSSFTYDVISGSRCFPNYREQLSNCRAAVIRAAVVRESRRT